MTKETPLSARGLASGLAMSLALASLCVTPPPARADNAAAIVIPGRRDVPVIFNGRDISGAVIEGDWGLYRPGAVSPTVIPLHPPVDWGIDAPPYYPSTGRRPGYGRREAPPWVRKPTTPAQSYFRSWGAQSDPAPATSSPPYDLRDLPPVILAPRQAHGPRQARPQHAPAGPHMTPSRDADRADKAR